VLGKLPAERGKEDSAEAMRSRAVALFVAQWRGIARGSSCYHTLFMSSRGAVEATLVVLAATALTIVATYPVAFHLDQLGRINTDDGRFSIWTVAWVAHKLTTQPTEVFHANIFYPHRYALAFSEANLGAGLMGSPVWLATKNPYTTHNVVFLATFVIAFAGAYYLARYLTGNRQASAVAAILFAFCPFIFARTAHMQLLFIGTLPFCMLAFHRLVDNPTVARSAGLGLVMWATAMCCAYYGIFAALMVGFGTLFYAISRRLWASKDYWIGIALAAFTSLGLTIPFFLPFLYVQSEMGFARTLDDARDYSANLGAWGASSAWAHRWWLPALGSFNETLFPGVLVTVLGVVGAVYVWRRGQPVARTPEPPAPAIAGPGRFPRDTALLYVLVAVLAFWLSFGPDAVLYRVLYDALPVFSFLRAPARIGLLVTLSLTVFAAAAIAQILARTRKPHVVAAALMAAAFAELSEFPLSQFRQVEPFSPVYSMLATLPRGAVAEFPYWYERSDFPRHAYYMLNSTVHWQPLINGYSDHIPADFRKTVVQLSSFPARDSFGILARADARYVVFHLDMYNTRLRERLFERLKLYSPYLRPLAQEGPVWLYEIVGWPN